MIGSVLSLGAVAMDYVLESPSLPGHDGFEVVSEETLLPGGSASNVSVSLASLGANVYQAGQIGDDQYGVIFRKTLRQDGVDDSYLITKPGGTTLHNYIITAPEGKHCILANLGDCVGTLEPDSLSKGLPEETDCLYVDLFSPKAALELARQAKEAGIPIVYNMQCPPSFMKKCGTNSSAVVSMLKMCSLFISGRDGYFEMTGEENPKLAMKQIWDRYRMPEGVIYTAGEEGAFWWDGHNMYKTEAFQVEAVDTTGAGDCFTGGLIYFYFLMGNKKPEALCFASASAAVKCMQKGPRSKASAEQIQRFLSDRREHKKIWR